MNNKKGFGLDIGATSLKLVWLNKQLSGFILKAALIMPVPPKGMLSESPLDEEEMAQTLRKAADTASVNTKKVNVALPENQVYTKVLDMPVLSDREVASAIYWEAEQYIPVPLTNIKLVWNVLKRPEKATPDEKMQVLMVGAPSMLVNKYQKIVSMAGLEINAMETEILATIRSLVLDENFPTSLVVNIGAISTSFAIVRKGIMVFTYSMAIGGAAINRAIATDFSLTPQQAEEYKRVYGISGKSLGGRVGKSTEPILNAILAEIKKSVAFYSQKYKDDSPIRQIILSGGTAKLPGIELFFAQNSGIETAIANPWKALASQQIPKEVLQNASDYPIAVGLAMRDYE
ncbi:MAG: type IV pilus assembly protein PilM [Candidatus Levybacteria bacterium]|nr:type IV pilus assembly protein PilM [Candidatus Levybacteria bacterium]